MNRMKDKVMKVDKTIFILKTILNQTFDSTVS